MGDYTWDHFEQDPRFIARWNAMNPGAGVALWFVDPAHPDDRDHFAVWNGNADRLLELVGMMLHIHHRWWSTQPPHPTEVTRFDESFRFTWDPDGRQVGMHVADVFEEEDGGRRTYLYTFGNQWRFYRLAQFYADTAFEAKCADWWWNRVD